MKKRILASFLAFAFVLINTGPLYASATTHDIYPTADQLKYYGDRTTLYDNGSTETFNDYYENIYGQGSSSGKTTIHKLINSFNVVSIGDIEGTHIVGPIATNSYAYGTRYSGSQFVLPSSYSYLPELYAVDYSRGMPSYIANFATNSLNFSTIENGNIFNSYSPTINMNFNFDVAASLANNLLFLPTPTGYNLQLYAGGTSNVDIQEYIFNAIDNSVVLSPYYSGRSAIKHNSNYMGGSFSSVWSDIETQSATLGTTQNLEGTPITADIVYYYSGTDATTYAGATTNVELLGTEIVVEPGTFVIIGADAGKILKTIDFDVQTGYNYTDGWADETIVTFLGTEINSGGTYNGKTVSQFPEITFDGAYPFTAATGLNNEYNEKGNKLIYNMPNLTGVLTTQGSLNTPGHLILPKAEFWNYNISSGTPSYWNGGNINGSIIAKEFHGGVTEIHMWAYDGMSTIGSTSIKPVEFTFNAEKYFDNSLSTSDDYDFLIKYWYDYKEGNDENSHAYATNETSSSGVISYSDKIYSEGTHTYTIEETNMTKDGIIYDKSVYRVDVEVSWTATKIAGVTTNEANIDKVTVTQIKDSDGNSIASPTSTVVNLSGGVYSVAEFYNETEPYTLPSTGGSGTQIYTICGLALMSTALIIGKKRGKKIC